jgi:hypothetical protein
MQRIALLRPSNLNTRRADENAILDFMRFAGIVRPDEFRIVAQAHIVAGHDEVVRRGLGATRSVTGSRRWPRYFGRIGASESGTSAGCEGP